MIKHLSALPILFFLLALSFILSAQTSRADEGLPGLSLETAILFALNNNPDMGIAGEKSEQSRYAVKEAQSAYYPRLSASANVGYEYNDPAAFPDGFVSQGTSNTNDSQEYTLQLNQMVFDGFSTSSEVKRRKQLYNSESLQNLAIEQKIILDTIEAYMDVYHYQNLVAEADRLIDYIARLNAKIDLMVEAGAENTTKQKYVQSRLSFARSEKNNAAASLVDAVTDLEFITGRLPHFTALRPQIIDVLSIDQEKFMAMALQENPTWLLNKSDEQAARYELDKAKGEYYPKVNLVMEYNRTKDVGGEIGNEDSSSVMLQMNYDIFRGFGREATKNRVSSEVREYDYKAERLRRTLKQKIGIAYNQIVAYETDLATVENEIITNQDLQKLYAEQFELGEGDIMNMVEGEERLYRSFLRKHQIEKDILLNAYELVQNVGLLKSGYFIAAR